MIPIFRFLVIFLFFLKFIIKGRIGQVEVLKPLTSTHEIYSYYIDIQMKGLIFILFLLVMLAKTQNQCPQLCAQGCFAGTTCTTCF